VIADTGMVATGPARPDPLPSEPVGKDKQSKSAGPDGPENGQDEQ
jgi:hypothetical protein